jgi:hypothetical protein
MAGVEVAGLANRMVDISTEMPGNIPSHDVSG